jgi:hypothetical protein
MKKKVAVEESPQLTTSALKRDLQVQIDDLVDHFLGVSHFMNRCLKFKRKVKADMVTYKEVYTGMQKKAKQLNITAFNQEYGHHSSECQHKCFGVY